MPVYNRESKLKEIIFHDMTVIPLINRFNIYLGVEDYTVGEITDKLSINTEVFLLILNTYVKDDYSPSVSKDPEELRVILDFLRKTNQYYQNSLLPTIEKHFQMLINISEASNLNNESNIKFLWKFFQELKTEMLTAIKNDEEIIFPSIEAFFGNKKVKLEKDLELSYENIIEDKVNDLVSFFVIHLKGVYNPNLLMGVITSVFTLDKEIKKNNRIRKKILMPLIKSLISK